MLWHGSKAGAFNLKTIVLESLTSMKRAGKGYICNKHNDTVTCRHD